MTLDKFFDDINETDLRLLIGTKVSGCKTIEYKECLPADTFDGQREFLAEVSSFANTAGGHLIYGIKEENGIPVALPGIPGKDLDCEILRLEKLLRDHLQPKCQGVMLRAIDMGSTAPIILIRIPESWAKPHVVDLQGHWRFYARNSTGKYALGVTELKCAFLETAGLGERIRSFHFGRLDKLSSGETPVPLPGKVRTVFHLLPYSAFESNSSLVSFEALEDIWSIPLMYDRPSSYSSNLDAVTVYPEKAEPALPEGYTQVFRNGIIESVSANLFGSSAEGPYLPSPTFERDATAFLEDCLAFYRKLSIHVPAVLLVSLVGVRDSTVHQHPDTWHKNINRIDRESFLFPEVIIENSMVNSAALLRPIFKAVSESAGWERLYGYEEAGEKDLFFPSEQTLNVTRGTRTKKHKSASQQVFH